MLRPENPEGVRVSDVELVPIGRLTPGCVITWQGKFGQVIGPAVVAEVLLDEAGIYFASVTHAGTPLLIPENVILSIEQGGPCGAK